MSQLRKVALLLHRYVGLTIAVFLIVSGLTGSLLAFHHELDAALNPELFEVTRASHEANRLDPVALRDRAEQFAPPGSVVSIVPLDTPPKRAVSFWVDLPGHLKDAGAHTEYFIDPFTGSLTGSRRWGDVREGRRGLMPFVYSLHSTLALGRVGELLLGVVALLWTIDCFVGAYLTFPVAHPSAVAAKRGWLSRWGRSWVVRWTKLFSKIFTWHRASGLWVWGMLFVFAWSGVSLNLHEVYHPVMRAVSGAEQELSLSQREVPLQEPALSFAEALPRARGVMAAEAKARGFQLRSERSLRYRPREGWYEYRAYSSRDISKKYANTTVWIDGNTGQRQAAWLPTGEAGHETFTTWIYQLHFGTIVAGGWPYRVLIVLLGIVVAVLSGTGVWIWWSKRLRRS